MVRECMQPDFCPAALLHCMSVLPAGKTSAQAEFTSTEHFNFSKNLKKKHLQSRCFFFGGATQI